MKKIFIKVTLLCALAFSTPFSFVSCKDYGNDIDRIDEVDKGISTQIASLQTALTATNSEVTAAKAAAAEAIAAAKAAKETGDAAAAAAAAAKAEAELAKQAAATAKTEAIAAAIEEAKKLVEGKASQEEVDKLASQIAGIEKGLNTLSSNVDELIQYKATVDMQLKALQLFKDEAEKQLKGIDAKFSALEETIKSLQDQLTAFQSTMASKSDLDAALLALSNEMDAKLKLINDQLTPLNKIAGVFVKRLTSITLIPELYIQGIPSIVFESAKYTPMKLDANYALVPTGAAAKIVSNNSTKINYRLNPASITATDVDLAKISFVNDVASSRSTTNDPIAIVAETAQVSNGVLTVSATKADASKSLNLPNNKFNIVSLRVPIHSDNLMKTEVAGEVAVFSEYVRIAEDEFLPQIANATDLNDHFNDHKTVYNSQEGAEISFNDVSYKENYNLAAKVTGCKFINNKNQGAIDAATLESYGFKFEFSMAKPEYIIGGNSTNQQEFASITEEGVLTPKTPGENGNTGLQAAPAVDKEPIIMVKLIDTKNSNNIIDIRFIKVKIVKSAVTDKWLPSENAIMKEYKRPLSTENITVEFSWDDMTNGVYSPLQMNKDTFNKIYTLAGYSYEGTGTLTNNVDGGAVAGTNALTWTLTPDQIKEVTNGGKDYFITAIFKDVNGLQPTIKFKLKITITAQTPKVVSTLPINWYEDGKVYPVLPAPYVAGTKCTYNNNLWLGFNYTSVGTLVTNLFSAGLPNGSSWDYQFAKSQDAISGYSASNNGYSMLKGGKIAASLAWDASHSQWVGIPTNTYTNVVLNKDNGGKDLLNAIGTSPATAKKVKVSIISKLNEWNVSTPMTYYLQFVAPLKIVPVLKDGVFYDKGTTPSTINIAKAFTMTDAYDNVVSQVNGTSTQSPSPSDLYNYYGVETATWDLGDARVGLSSTGAIDNTIAPENCPKITSIPDLKLTQNGSDLTFTNNGSTTTKEYRLYVKATISHIWGMTSEWITITVKPGSVQPK